MRVGASIGGLAIVASLAVAGCESSSTTSVAPSASRCGVTLSVQPASFGESGGQGAVSVGTNRECTWDARSEAPWLTFTSDASGQGSGSIAFTVVSNPAVAERRAAIVVNAQRVEVSQAEATCVYRLDSTRRSVGPDEVALTVAVSAQSGCSWNAASQASWISLTSGAAGNGNGVVTAVVVENRDHRPRTGTLAIAGQTFVVEQAEAPLPPPPAPTPSPTPIPPPAPTPTPGPAPPPAPPSPPPPAPPSPAPPPAPPAPAPPPPAPAPPAPTPPPPPSPAPAPTPPAPPPPPPAPPAPACAFEVSPLAVNIPQPGGDRDIHVDTDRQCAWAAASQVAWIAINRTSGTGSENVKLDVAANPSPTSRAGAVTIAGRTVTVTQAGTDGQSVDIKGVISGLSGSCPAIRFIVDGEIVRTDADTEFRKTDCVALRNGDSVKVKGVRQGSEVRATRVEKD